MPTEHLHLVRESDGYYRCAWHDSKGKRHRKSFGKARRAAEDRFAQFRAE